MFSSSPKSPRRKSHHNPDNNFEPTNKALSVSLASLVLALPISVLADQTQQTENLSPLEEEILWLKEETYVTTATKTLEDIKKSGSTVSIITAQELQNMGARNLMDALKRVPGLGITINNIGLPVIEVRGVKTDFSEKVLFLMNGHAINNNLINGGATWSNNNFLIDNMKRVEIVRGPGSALYGANAFVAVINIITKTADDIDGTQVSLSLGDNKTRKINIQTGQKFNGVDAVFNATLFDTDGYRNFVESDVYTNSSNTNDWNKQFNLGFNLSFSDFSFQTRYVKRNSGPYIGFGNALNDESEQDYAEYFLELSYQRTLTENSQFNQRLYYNNFNTDNFWELSPEGFPTADYPEGILAMSPITAESFGTEIQFEYLSNDHKLIFGLMAEHQSIFDIGFDANFNPTTGALLPGGYQDIYDRWPWLVGQQRDIQAAFLQDIWDINNSLRLIIGARYDYYSDIGGSFNPRSSLSWEFSKDHNLTFTYGSAFRAPNFGELYNQNNPAALGNPNLTPEEIDTFEISLNSKINKRTGLRITAFRNKISDLITFVSISSAENISRNANKLDVNGLEFEVDTRLRDGSNLNFNYTYQYAVDKENNSRIAKVPMHKANTSYNYRYSQFLSSYIALNYIGSIKREAPDSRSDISEYATIDIALNLKSPNKSTEVNISIYNLFNEKYADAAHAGTVNSDYPKPDRNFLLEVSQNF
tara:strand:+ start:5919 stop:8030 length:2112 start_codon:yes stop_codon:yes gene_type:complete